MNPQEEFCLNMDCSDRGNIGEGNVICVLSVPKLSLIHMSHFSLPYLGDFVLWNSLSPIDRQNCYSHVKINIGYH